MSEEEKWGEDDVWESGGDYVEVPLVKSPPKSPFTSLSISDIESRFNTVIQNCVDLCQISSDEATILLLHFSWDYDKLQDQWFSMESKIRKDCGIPSVAMLVKVDTQCPVCFEDINEENSAYLKCKHAFCMDCWKGHLTAELDKGIASVLAKCPYHKCTSRVGPSLFKRFLTKDLYAKYKRFLSTIFVDNNNRTLRWCPNPGCKYIVEVTSPGILEVTCECGCAFCFACGADGHLPVNCDMNKKWTEKNTAESGNVTWIAANTKPCSKCKKPIEKNQGCNHMTCSQCKHEFCWICLGDWRAHNGNYSCNKINKDLWNKQSNAKAELERYMFYFERYENHIRAIRKANELKDSFGDFATHMTTLKRFEMEDMKFLWTCLNSLINTRRVLANSYVLGYYLKNIKQVQLFEFMQKDLEMTCESFHELIERRKDEFVISDDDNNVSFLAYKSQLINIANVTTKFYQGFIKGISTDLPF